MRHFKDGIYSDHSYSNLVANDIVEYGRYGVHLMYCSNYVIENVTSRSNIAGMALMYSENVTVRHNLVADNWGVVGYGIFTRAVDNLTLEDNLVYGNVYGILFYEDPYSPGNYALVRQNTIAFNYIGISLDDESAVSFSSNDIIENVEDVLRIGSASNSSTWDGNFWSSYLSSASSNRPVAVSDPVQDIVDGYPQLRLYMFSPAYLSLEAMMNALPAHAVVKAVDSHPSARPITQLSAKRSFSAAWFFGSTVIILAAVLAIVLARRPAARRRMPVDHD